MHRNFVIAFGFLPVFVIVGVVVMLWVGGSGRDQPVATDDTERELALYNEVRTLLLQHFDGEVEPRDLADAALAGMSRGTGDEYTRVNPPVQAKLQDRDLQGGSFGIGCGIDQNEDGSIRITYVQPGGGAEKAGVLAEDVIVGVDGTSILGQPLSASRLRIQSDVEGSTVILDVRRGGSARRGTDPAARKLSFTITRSRVEQNSVHDVHIAERHGRRLGYLAVSDFHANTFDPQFKEAVATLLRDGAEGLVVDLRGNGGGQVPPAVHMADAFLSQKDALIVFTQSSKESNRGRDQAYRTKDETSLTDLPLVLLVDSGTASASEIFTGALKDHGRALVVGERTHGKGLVQTIFRLQTDSQYTLNITTTRYYTPLGKRVQKGTNGEPGGIVPDIEVRYRAGERDSIRLRMAMRRAVFNREELAQQPAWNTEDRMLETALSALAGKPVTLKDRK